MTFLCVAAEMKDRAGRYCLWEGEGNTSSSLIVAASLHGDE